MRWYLEGMYGEVEEGVVEEEKAAFTVSTFVLIYLVILFVNFQYTFTLNIINFPPCQPILI